MSVLIVMLKCVCACISWRAGLCVVCLDSEESDFLPFDFRIMF